MVEPLKVDGSQCSLSSVHVLRSYDAREENQALKRIDIKFSHMLYDILNIDLGNSHLEHVRLPIRSGCLGVRSKYSL